MRLILLITVLGFSFFAAATALAGEGYIVGGATLRAGPDRSYPSVGMLGNGTPVTIQGCVNGWSWCDVGTPEGRGWVAGSALQQEYEGRRVFVPEYGERIGIGFVTFDFGNYWDSNYRNRPWYGERERYRAFRPQYQTVVVDVNIRSRERGRDEHGRDERGRDQHGRDRHPPPNNGVEPRRPMEHAAPPERAVHPAPAGTKPPTPKPAEPKAQPKPRPDHADSKAADNAQH